MTFKEQLAYRAKAILAAAGLAVVGLTEWLVQDPSTATAIEHVLPAPYAQLVPPVLGAVSAWLVHRVPNATLTAPVAEVPTDTTLVRLASVNSGEFTGTPAH